MPSVSPQRLFGLTQPFDEQVSLVTSPFFRPTVLASIRLIFASYSLFIALFVLIWDVVRTHNGKAYLSYFTDLSYIGLCSYFWASAVQSVYYAFVRVKRGKHGYPLQRWPRALQFLHLMLMSTVVTFPILVTIVYWGLLASSFETREAAFTGISQHALNTVFCLFEIVFTDIPPPFWGYLPICIAFLGGYLGVAYITHITQGFYTYGFLDPKKEGGLLAAYIVGIAVAEIIIFIIVHYAIVLRIKLTSRRSSRRSTDGGEVQQLDEWEAVERPKTPLGG